MDLRMTLTAAPRKAGERDSVATVSGTRRILRELFGMDTLDPYSRTLCHFHRSHAIHGANELLQIDIVVYILASILINGEPRFLIPIIGILHEDMF